MKQRTKLQIKVGTSVIVILGAILGSLFVFSNPSSAIENSVAQKAVLYGLSQCYKDGAITSNVTGSSYDGPYTLMTYGGSNHVLPTGKYDIEYASCSELLNGKFDTDFPGAISMAGINAPQDSANTGALSSFLTGLGYEETKGTSGRCASYTYKYDSNDSTAVYKMCADTEKIDGKDVITGDMMEVSGDTVAMSMKVKDGVVELYCDQIGRGGCTDHSFTKGVTGFDEFAGEILADLKEHNSSAVCFLWWCPWKLVESVDLEDKSDVMATYEIENTTSAINKMIKYLSNGSYTSISSLSLSSNERITLLQDYLINYYKVKVYGDRCNLDESQQAIARTAGYDEITTTMFGGGLQTCWITPTEHKKDSVVAYSRGGYIDGTMMSYSDIITALGGTVNTILDSDKARCNSAATTQYDKAQDILANSTNEEEIQRANVTISELDTIKREHGEYWYTDESGAIVCYTFTGTNGEIVNTTTTSPSIPEPDSPSDDDGGSAPTCFSDGSALGWILCPALEIMSNAVNGMYDEVANNWLEVGANEMEASNSNGVYVGWKTFRDIANVIFVIMLIIVIFSQVTGFGLSNYGVKKALPTLIMVAILVNLSFILCQIAVDATNILGDGLREMFEGLKVGTGTGVGLSDIVTGISSGLLQLAVVGGAVGLGIHFSGASFGMLLVPLLLALISALIGTLMFFLSLAIRKAGIFAMVVLCPVAIICYALPNTKKFFDRWMKLFTALLMVYPICGILMGGGRFFSSILLTSGENSFFMALTAMLIQVVPFFFIPTLVKGSLNMMGNIGAKLSNLGSRLTRTAQGTLGRSHWAQERQQRLLRDANIRRDTRLQNHWKARSEELKRKRDEQGDKFSQRNQRRLRRAEYEFARANSRYERAAKEEEQASAMANQELFTEGSTRRTAFRDSLADKLQEENISNLRSAAYHGHLDSVDENGNKHVVDVKNIGGITAGGELMEYEMEEDGEHYKLDSNGQKIPVKGARNSLSAAFLNYNRAYDKAMADYNAATTTSDKDAAMARAQDAKLKAQAIATELLDAGGDNGQTAVGRALKSIKFDNAGNPLDRGITQSVDEISKYITRNGKWMAQIKKTDNGLFRMLNDAANEAATFKTRTNYATGGDLKVTAEAVPDFSDGYLGGVTYEISQGSYDNDAKAAGRLIALDEAVQRAMSDPRIANRIKPETMKFLKTIHQKAYELQQKQWIEATDDAGNLTNISQLFGYADDGTGNMDRVQADGFDQATGELYRNVVDSSTGRSVKQVLHASADATSPVLKATEAYSKQIRQATELVRGKVQDGEVKILRKRDLPADWEYDSQKKEWGRRVPMTVNPNTHIVTPAHWEALSPEEAAKARQITEYNASVDIQNQGGQNN